METITLPFTPLDYTALIGYMLRTSARSELLPLDVQSIDAILYREYLKKNERWASVWEGRAGKVYATKLPLACALALWRMMPQQELTPFEQGVLNILDKAIVNYRPAHHEPMMIGDLMRKALYVTRA